MRRLRAINMIFFAIGAAALAILIWHTGPRRIAEGLARVGLTFPLVCLAHFVAIALDSVMLRACSGRRATFRAALRASLAGHAINEATPMAKLGEITKFSLLSESIPADRAAAALIVQNITMFVVSCASISAGAFLTMASFSLPGNLGDLVLLCAVAFAIVSAAALFIFVVGIGSWPFALLTICRVSPTRVGRWQARWTEVEGHWQTVRRDRSQMAINGTAAVLSRGASIAQAALILEALGSSDVLVAAVMSDALFQVVLWATSFIPMQIGTHEAGSYALFSAVGLSPSAGLLLELVRKLRRLVFVGVGVAVLGFATFRRFAHKSENGDA